MQVEIISTTDYAMFKHLLGNRDVTQKRINAIKASIEACGYISNPIICNEKYEIIDGQGRLGALHQLGLPVEYRVIEGLGINECRAMNLKPTAWKLSDFVKSYADMGDESYIRLIELNKKYGFSYGALWNINSNEIGLGSATASAIRKGEITISEAQYYELDKVCRYIKNFEPIWKQIGGRSEVFQCSLGWILKRDGVDADRLYKNLKNRASTFSPFVKVENTLRDMSNAYNYGQPKNKKRMFEYEYKMREE